MPDYTKIEIRGEYDFDDLWDLGEELISLMGDLFWQIGDDAKDVGRKIVEVNHDCEDMAVSGITSIDTG